jgi:mannose-1-phosphate guanylyltransferase/mannose-6-phosphate isomerase
MLFLFNVDETFTKKEMINFMHNLYFFNKKIKLGIISDSNIEQIKIQIGLDNIKLFDYIFCENGTAYYKKDKLIKTISVRSYISQENINKFISKCLILIGNLDIPIKSGTFIEIRNSMINISPIGENSSQIEKDEFVIYDKKYFIIKNMIENLKEEFNDLNLEYSISDQISFDVFPKNFNKTLCLEYLKDIEVIHFFDNNTNINSNDNEFYNDPKVIEHRVINYLDTIKICNNILIPYIPVILCNTSSSILFPKSKQNLPKHFIKVNSEYSFLQNTILRFKHHNHIILVSNINNKHIIEFQLNELNLDIEFEIYLEPSEKNTAPTINLITQLKPNNKLLFVNCDTIYDTKIFNNIINKTLKRNDPIITFGIKPTYPNTNVGYLEYNQSEYLYRFVEKPNEETAEQFIKSGNYYWNSGIYLLDANYINKLFKEYQLSIYEIIRDLINDIKIDKIYYIISSEYNACLNISIENGIFELLPSNSIYMIQYNGLWNHIETFKSIHNIVQKDNFNINISNHINYNSNNCLIDSNKLVLLNNVSNLIISEVDDCILVSDINSSQDIKQIFELSKNKKEIKSNKIDYRPWGYYEILSEFNGYKIKKISVYPSKKLSLQSHNYRREQWTCIKGYGLAQIDNNFIDLYINKSIEIEINQKHRLINNSKELLQIIEIQLGNYLEEDDIIRYEDDYYRT